MSFAASIIGASVAAPIIGQIVGGIIGGNQVAQGQQQGSQQQAQYLQQGANALNTGFTNAQPYVTNAYNTATGAITGNYGNAIAGFAPYQGAGAAAANELKNLITSGYASHQFNTQDLYNGLSPNYNFQLQQGQQATNQAANATGGMIGANALQGLQSYTQNFAANAYQNAFNNYQTQRNNIFSNIQPVANMGLAATKYVGDLYSGQGNALANLATGYGSSMANLNTGLATALAGNYGQQGLALGSGTIGSANALGNMYSNIGGPAGVLVGNALSNSGSTTTSTSYPSTSWVSPTIGSGGYSSGGTGISSMGNGYSGTGFNPYSNGGIGIENGAPTSSLSFITPN